MWKYILLGTTKKLVCQGKVGGKTGNGNREKTLKKGMQTIAQWVEVFKY